MEYLNISRSFLFPTAMTGAVDAAQLSMKALQGVVEIEDNKMSCLHPARLSLLVTEKTTSTTSAQPIHLLGSLLAPTQSVTWPSEWCHGPWHSLVSRTSSWI